MPFKQLLIIFSIFVSMKEKESKWASFHTLIMGAEVNSNDMKETESLILSKYATQPRFINEKHLEISKDMQDEFIKSVQKEKQKNL